MLGVSSALLEAGANPKMRREVEGLLCDLFRRGADQGATFDRSCEHDISPESITASCGRSAARQAASLHRVVIYQ